MNVEPTEVRGVLKAFDELSKLELWFSQSHRGWILRYPSPDLPQVGSVMAEPYIKLEPSKCSVFSVKVQWSVRNNPVSEKTR